MNKTLTIQSFAASLCAALILIGCGERTPEEAADGSHPPAAEEGDHGHGHGAGGEKRTHFTEHTELFVEFPRLVVGEESAFAAHLTRLADFRALGAGKVTVRLAGGGQQDEAFSVDSASPPGIFRPLVVPRYPGERTVSVEVETPEFSVTHTLGVFTVYPDRKAADAAPAPQDDEGIVFTKEQQWKIDFATSEVVTRPIRSAINATGVLRARPDGEALMTALVPGQIRAADSFPRLGQQVKKGQLLAYLVPRLGGETDLASLRAAADKARVEHELARQERTRMEALYRAEAVPEKRVLAARAAETSARAELAAAQQRYGQYGGGGGGIPLRSPIAGTLADVRVVSGAFAPEGATLFHVIDRRNLWLELRVPESEAARLGRPSGAAFKVAGSEAGVDIVTGRNGKVVAVGGVVDPTTRTVPVVFEFAPGDLALPVGMAVQAQVFAGGTRDAVAIPASSVLDEGGMSVVFVMNGGESFERRQVRLGARDGDWVEVVDGLTPGMRVVSRGTYLVKLAATGTAQIGHGHAH